MGNRTKAELINTKTKEIKELFCRSDNKRCDFMDDFFFGRFHITLRLDWGGLDDNFQEPTLDADVYIFDEKTGKRKKYKAKKKEWHHTEIEKIPEEKFKYRFSFHELELIFERRITTQNFLNGKIKIINSKS